MKCRISASDHEIRERIQTALTARRGHVVTEDELEGFMLRELAARFPVKDKVEVRKGYLREGDEIEVGWDQEATHMFSKADGTAIPFET